MKLKSRLIFMTIALVVLTLALGITASAAGTQAEGIGFVKADSLRMRSQPNTGSQILANAPTGECVVVLGRTGDWYHVSYNLQQGYMHSDYLTVLKKENAELGYGKVVGTGVNLRSGAGTGYSSVATANTGDKAYILGLNDGWYKVIFGTKICYIRSDFLELTEIPYENQKSPNAPKFFRGGKSTGVAPSAAALNGDTVNGNPNTGDSQNVTGVQILKEAQKYLGAPYVYGGASPAGFDCSGYVYYVLKSLGFSPYRTPEDQFRQGSPVKKSDLQPGDIVFFFGTYSSKISHVGIYAGNGQFVHAPNSRSVVSYSDLTTGYWSDHYYGARRMTK